jgi:mono/diheme cytochrome c family protein
VFSTECTDCHGAGGRGDGPQARTFALDVPKFTAADFWSERPALRLKQSIREGRGDDMPAFGKKLTEEEIDAVLALVEARFRPSPTETTKTVNP